MKLFSGAYTCALLLVSALSAGAAFAQTRIVTDDAGNQVTIPATPRRIVALRDEDITAPLMEVGANVVATVGVVSPQVNGGRPFVRGAYQALDFRFEHSPIAFVGVGNNFDIEAVAAAKPDLIFAPTSAASRRDQLMAIAPTVLINVGYAPGNTPLARYRRLADFSGHTERYQQLEAAFRERLADYKAIAVSQLGDAAKVTLSLISFDNGTVLTGWRHFWMLTAMIDELGFSYPAATARLSADRLTLSAEHLPQLQGDFLVSIMRWGFAPGTPAEMRAQMDKSLPAEWSDFLHAPKNRQWLFIDLDMSRTGTFATARWVLDWLMANVVMRDYAPLPAQVRAAAR